MTIQHSVTDLLHIEPLRIPCETDLSETVSRLHFRDDIHLAEYQAEYDGPDSNEGRDRQLIHMFSDSR